MNSGYIINTREISGKTVPVASTALNVSDNLGTVMVRWNINRNNYRVAPGLYAVGDPGNGSDVLVTANYKLTFDNLRKNLSGMNVWILVLDTKGVNVWCAAGKGTFGTKELVRKVREYSLGNIVSHRRLIVPQLGATGVAAHKVKEETGFHVTYGPVRASDIKEFISSGYRKDKKMTRVTFDFKDRVKLIPNDFIYGKFYLLGAAALMILLSWTGREGFKPDMYGSFSAFLNIFLAYFAGVVITPALLPWIPARAFAMKGFYVGALVFLILLFSGLAGISYIQQLSWFLIIIAVSSFMAMNFTGSSTYTSLSGVQKEMKTAVPLQIGAASTGIILNVLSKFIN